MDTWTNKIINQNLQGEHGHIDNGSQCATIELEAPMARGLPNPWLSNNLLFVTISQLYVILCHHSPITFKQSPLSNDMLFFTIVLWLVISHCPITCYLSPLSSDLLFVTIVQWLVICHHCPVTCYLSPLSNNLLSITILQ